MTQSTQSVSELFEAGLARYNEGETPQTLLPLFQGLADRAPRNAAIWSCLAWLHLLLGEGAKAQKAAQKSVKLDPQAPQARINLALALMANGQKGVRDHVQVVQQLMVLDSDIINDLRLNIEEGLARRPDWADLKKVQGWLGL